MRFLFGMVFASLAVLNLSAGTARASDVEVKGPHICCGMCVAAVGKILGKVDGVSEVKADAKSKTVTFKAKDDAAANAGVKALVDGGFFGSATADGKELKIDAPAEKKGEKADKLTVKGVHACCGMCHTAIKNIFSDSKVTIEGKGPQRTIIIEGTGLERSAVLEALRKTGFNGKIEK
jgi:periplasmic mercuric ion binding protein